MMTQYHMKNSYPSSSQENGKHDSIVTIGSVVSWNQKKRITVSTMGDNTKVDHSIDGCPCPSDCWTDCRMDCPDCKKDDACGWDCKKED